jgi:hypothetical protein
LAITIPRDGIIVGKIFIIKKVDESNNALNFTPAILYLDTGAERSKLF